MEPSLIYLEMLPVEQKGWLTLYLKGGEFVTAQAIVGHIGTSSVIVLSALQSQIPKENIEQAEFRYINQTGLYTFTSSALDIQGYEHGRVRLCMNPPYSMTHHQQREFIRVEPEAQLSVAFTPIFPDEYHSGTGIIKNISGNGLLFVTDEFIHNESILKVTFLLPDAAAPISGIGQVVRKQFVDDETVASIQFLELDPAAQKRIISYCVEEQLRLAQRQHQQKRKYARVTSSEPIHVSIRDVESKQTVDGLVRNIGGGGLLVSLPEQIEHSPLLQISLHLPTLNNPIQAYAKVVAKNENYLHLEFVDINQADQEQIINYVLEQQLLLLQTPAEKVGLPNCPPNPS